mgnify:CR=1 FL=1
MNLKPPSESRSKNMSAVKSKKTKLEEKVSKELWKRGLRFRKNVNNLYGTPDIAVKKYKTVVFLDSCFWHGCKIHGTIPKTNREFWEKKIKRNIERDKEVTDYYINKGWNILRVWEHDLKANFDKTIEKIIKFLETNRK